MTESGCTHFLNEEISLGNWPTENWWEKFEDPTLNQLIATAIEKSPTLKKAEARFKGAFQIALQKKAKLYPEIDFNAEDNWQHLSRDGLFRAFGNAYPPIINQVDIGFNFNYEFDFWGKNRDLFQASLGRAFALEAEQKQAELILTTSIAYTYFQAQFLLVKLDLLGNMETNTKKLLQITKQREKHALDTAFDRIQSTTELLDVQKELLETEESLRRKIHELKALSGLGQDVALELEIGPLRKQRLSLPQDLSLSLLTRRPDLVAQVRRVEAFALEIEAAKTDFYPNINLVAIAGIETLKGGLLDVVKNFSGSFAPILSLPIFTAGRLRAQLYEKVAAFDEAVHGYNELILRAAQQVANSVTSLQFLEKELLKELSIYKEADLNYTLTKARVDHALNALPSLIQVDNERLKKELSVKLIAYMQALIDIELIYALGGGYKP